LYCVGCEAYYTADELVDGKCPEHLTVPEEIEEENYFFALTKYQSKLIELFESKQIQIYSSQYRNEVLGFIKTGLEDFSISRSIQRGRGVGVPVPDDTTQVMYVWFDALSIYLTAVGFGTDQQKFEKHWPADVHVIGKGILRFHAVYWIAMLLSAGLAVPKSILVHGYITANGQKMSKSLGNVIDPFDLVERYGLEPVRYFLLRHIPTFGDGDFSEETFSINYTAFLSNGLGNLCSRIAKLCEKASIPGQRGPLKLDETYASLFNQQKISEAAHVVFSLVDQTDQWLSQVQPWKAHGEAQVELLTEAIQRIRQIAYHLQPFMPETAEKIQTHFSSSTISALPPLFPRLA
jgi:methionyl-tRNA synthetase